MNIKRYINGEPVEEEDLQKIILRSEFVDKVINDVNERIKNKFRQGTFDMKIVENK